MAGVSALDPISPLADGDTFYVEQGGQARRATLAQIARLGGVRRLGVYQGSGTNLDIPVPAGFRTVRVLAWLMADATAGSLFGRLSDDGGATFEAGGQYTFHRYAARLNNSTGFSSGVADADEFQFYPQADGSLPALLDLRLTAYDQAGLNTLATWAYNKRASGTDARIVIGGGRFTVAGAHDAVRLFRSAGDFAAWDAVALGYN